MISTSLFEHPLLALARSEIENFCKSTGVQLEVSAEKILLISVERGVKIMIALKEDEDKKCIAKAKRSLQYTLEAGMGRRRQRRKGIPGLGSLGALASPASLSSLSSRNPRLTRFDLNIPRDMRKCRIYPFDQLKEIESL